METGHRSFAWLAAALVGVAGCAAEPPPASEHVGQMVYIDRATGKPIVANIAKQMPAIHPDTGERTLDPAMYCSACREWHIVPPLERLHTVAGATLCKKTGTKLVIDGPWPDEAGSR